MDDYRDLLSKEFSFENFSLEENDWRLFNNMSLGFSKEELDLIHSVHWRIMIIVLYILVIFIGFTGNIVIAIVIIGNKTLHSVTNIFIANLALSDIGMCVLNLPFQLHYQLSDNWVFGKLLCHVISASFAIPIYDSTMCILMIAIDRYILIVYPFKKRMSNSLAVLLVGMIAFLAIGPAIPMAIYTKMVVRDDPIFNIHRTYCAEVWPSELKRRIYSVSLFLLQFCIPIIATTILYSKIYVVLKNRPLKKTENKRNQRTNRILVAIVALFTACWLPWNIFSLITEFNYSAVKGKYFKLIDLFIKIFAMSSSCINPFLYGWLNENFKKELSQMLGCSNKKKKSRRSGHELLENTNHADHQQNITLEIVSKAIQV